MTADTATEPPQKVWTLPRRDFERRLRIPDGWHLAEVNFDGCDVKVVALPDKAVA